MSNYNSILKAKREALIPKESMSSKLFRAQREGLDIDFVSGRDDGEGPREGNYTKRMEEAYDRLYPGRAGLTETEHIIKYGGLTPF